MKLPEMKPPVAPGLWGGRGENVPGRPLASLETRLVPSIKGGYYRGKNIGDRNSDCRLFLFF